MKIILFGKNGQVGWELQRSLAPLGELVALDRYGLADLIGDLTDLEGIRRTIQTVKPDIIVNAAAYTAVDRAEEEPDTAFHMNAIVPGVMAREAASLGCWLVHYSTDYVFDGSGETPWREESPTNPVNIYGLTKVKGEEAVQQSGCRNLIFRTSWVYGAHGNNFIKTMLRLMADREELNVVSDQIGAPAGAELIADVTARALCRANDQPELAGLYNLAPSGETSWYEYAQFIAAQARQFGLSLKLKNINPIPTSEYFTPARRPLNSRLDTQNLRGAFSLHLPNWQQGVSRVIQEITAERP